MKKFRVILFAFVVFAFALLLAMILFSPYGKSENENVRQVRESLVINASAEKVYDYLGNSSNAKEWSVFVEHITPLNDKEVLDGEVNSKRRCFT